MRLSPASILLVPLLVAASPAQRLRGPVAKPDAGVVWSSEHHDLAALVVKFAEGRPVRRRDGRFVGRDDLAAVHAALAGASVQRLFHRSEEELDADRARVLAALDAGTEPPADLNQYFRATFADARAGARALAALNALPCVEIAFPEHRATVPCEPGDILPPTPSFDAQQGYRDPAPNGIDQRRSRAIPGGRGDGVQVIDIESSWRLAHEDIAQLTAANVIGAHDESLNPNHGCAVIGELAADWDQWGMSGLVDRTSIKVHSHMRQFWAASVDTAAANSRPGDVIVLEVQLTDSSGRLVPMEYRQDVFDSVRNAVLAGIHVIAAAGNGSNDLDSPVFGGLFDRSVRDSGAVLVGATEGSQLVRAAFSNHGSRVDANGWGRNVASTGYGALFDPGDVRQQYTASFSGTSSATPIVAAAAVALLGAAREQLGTALSPAQLRALLQAHGTDVPGGRIGRRPDLMLLLQAIGLPRGLRIVQDAGLGGTVQLAVDGAPGAFYVVAAAFGRGRQTIAGIGELLLDPATLYPAFTGVVPAAGSSGHAFAIPNVQALRGLDLFLQALQVAPSGTSAALTSSVGNHVP